MQGKASSIRAPIPEAINQFTVDAQVFPCPHAGWQGMRGRSQCGLKLAERRPWACASALTMASSSGIHRWSRHYAAPCRQLLPSSLVSDATGETLTTVARAATAQYTKVLPVEHVHPLVRSQKQLDRVLTEIEESPGLVLYTLLDEELTKRLEDRCRELSLPCLSILGPVLQLLRSYLGAETSHRIGAQHTLNAEYFKRIDALNYTMLHDDGQHLEGLEEADVVLVGVSRTSKTPTSIYLANRGVKTSNVPLVPGVEVSRPRGGADPAVGGRSLCQPGADRSDTTEPVARAQGPSRRRSVYRPQSGSGGSDVLAQAMRTAQLAEHRCDAPLDRGDRSGRVEPARRSSPTPGRMSNAALARREAARARLPKREPTGDPARRRASRGGSSGWNRRTWDRTAECRLERRPGRGIACSREGTSNCGDPGRPAGAGRRPDFGRRRATVLQARGSGGCTRATHCPARMHA